MYVGVDVANKSTNKLSNLILSADFYFTPSFNPKL